MCRRKTAFVALLRGDTSLASRPGALRLRGALRLGVRLGEHRLDDIREERDILALDGTARLIEHLLDGVAAAKTIAGQIAEMLETSERNDRIVLLGELLKLLDHLLLVHFGVLFVT